AASTAPPATVAAPTAAGRPDVLRVEARRAVNQARDRRAVGRERAEARQRAVTRKAERSARLVAASVAARPAVAARSNAVPAVATTVTTAVAPAPAVAVSPAAVAHPVVAKGRPAKPGDAAHVVRPGESLWSIAADVLGGEASPARIAREVNRLWERNKDRIGTGDRNLLMTGTRLVL
ncbi:MAG TPA: LysM domain-containing protein, partial [Solirubrobacter sp.]|nr:LysM domain-containing protein [Solirubrobacter sp.]